jgi:hypothetical protein
MDIGNYLDQLTLDYAQLCQRVNGSIYGIADGKQCKKGKPISLSQAALIKAQKAKKNQPKIKPGLKRVKVGKKDTTKAVVAKAKAIGLNNNEIRKIKEEVKIELNAKKVKGLDALKLFAKKANKLAKQKKEKELKPSPVESVKNPTWLDALLNLPVSSASIDIQPESSLSSQKSSPTSRSLGIKTRFFSPESPKGYNIQKDIDNPGSLLGGGAMGKVWNKKGPPPGVLKQGKLGQYEAEALGVLKGTGVAPDFHGVKYSSDFPKTVKSGLGGHVKEVQGNLAMSKMEGETLSSLLKYESPPEREKMQRAYFVARKTIHQLGVAHNDMHGKNALLKPDGSVGLVDFGLAQVGFKYALIEAMGFANGDWQAGLLHLYGDKFDKKSQTYKTLLSNREKAVKYMQQNFGFYWDGYNSKIPKEIRTPDSKINNSPLANLTDTEIQKVLSILYEGI